MGIVTFQIKKGEPTSHTVRQRDVMAPKPGTGELKYIGYFKGQNTVFVEDITNKDLKPSTVPDFVFNPERNKCELRVDDRDKALLKYIVTHPHHNVKWEEYSEDIENKRKLSKAEQVEEALEYIKESNEVRIGALGLAVLGKNEAYRKSSLSIKALLKDKAINKPKEIINACEDPLFDMKFTASLAICSNIIQTNATMTAIVWSDNQGRIMNIATGEDFIVKLAQHLSSKTPESKALLQEIGNRLNISQETAEKESAEANEIARLKAQLEAAKTDLEIETGKREKLEQANDKLVNGDQPSLKELAIIEARNKYKDLIGKNVPFKFQNDMEWMQQKMNEHKDG